jgi:hypothetical protein
MEQDNVDLNRRISSLTHEHNNLLGQIQQLETCLVSNRTIIVDDSFQFDSSRHVSDNYQRLLERQVQLERNNDDLLLSDVNDNNEHTTMLNGIVDELDQLIFNQATLFELIYRVIVDWSSSVVQSKILVSCRCFAFD